MSRRRMPMRAAVAVVVLGLLAAACGRGSDADETAGDPVIEITTSTTTAAPPNTVSSTTVAVATTAPATSSTTARAQGSVSEIGADLDGDGVDELLVFDAVEPPMAAQVFELDTTTESGRVPVMLDGEPLTLHYTYYSGEPDPAGEAWFGCVDLDGSGVERLARGSFTYDAAAGETSWTLRPIEWAADLVAVEGAARTGAYPAGEWSVSDLMPGRRLCKTQSFSVAVADGCSAEGLVAPPTPAVLGAEAAATYRAIVDAAVACDFHELGRIAGAEITLSFGSHDDVAAYLAQGEYLQRGEPLRVLVQLMAMEPGRQDEFDTWVWPPFWKDDAVATAAERAQIEAIFGVPFDELLVDTLGYIDYRIGIDTDGEWLYFVAGD